ncbi:response regulator [Phenylobacterium deserti]|uniref:histidine kinase n=1 Tax=Phenylobacterium deserti TaxID=1914756 RepID=A0A328ANX3_9CAUL|nr:response regulator [Phenylobacterium deserti]RAK56703.1 diguanylate cyclase [Phenylobacterium deserti]
MASTSDPRPVEYAGWDRLRRPVWLFDPTQRRKLYANQAAAELWGAANPDALMARDFSQQSDAVQRRLQRLVNATANGDTVHERWTYYPHGKPVTVEAAISAFEVAPGLQALLFEAVPAEVEPEERRAVEALRHTTTLVTLFDTAGAALFSNPAAFAAYGALDFIGRFQNPEHGKEVLEAVLAAAPHAEFVPVRTLAGERIHHLEARALLDPVTGQSSLLLSERDVTAQVEAEQRAERAAARQRFLSTMSHELRTPLNSVLGFGELLRRTSLDAEQRGHLDRVMEAGDGLLRMINELIALSDVDSDAAPAFSAAAPQPTSEEQAEATRALRVLYADDHEGNRLLVQTVLTAQGHECDVVSDGAEAVHATRGRLYDLILMDIQMPVKDGVSATQEIRASPGPEAAIPILAVTANTLSHQLDVYASVGMNGCIAKPVDFAELIAKVEACVT